MPTGPSGNCLSARGPSMPLLLSRQQQHSSRIGPMQQQQGTTGSSTTGGALLPGQQQQQQLKQRSGRHHLLGPSAVSGSDVRNSNHSLPSGDNKNLANSNSAAAAAGMGGPVVGIGSCGNQVNRNLVHDSWINSSSMCNQRQQQQQSYGSGGRHPHHASSATCPEVLGVNVPVGSLQQVDSLRTRGGGAAPSPYYGGYYSATTGSSALQPASPGVPAALPLQHHRQ
eukprot:GHVU01124333.1.p1 GENE.GHVU01124333.1~~GHVU01124333.1.p1  ORF type:complete len:260 (+),score=39.84 GHVU01124333.1:104-781(+)